MLLLLGLFPPEAYTPLLAGRQCPSLLSLPPDPLPAEASNFISQPQMTTPSRDAFFFFSFIFRAAPGPGTWPTTAFTGKQEAPLVHWRASRPWDPGQQWQRVAAGGCLCLPASPDQASSSSPSHPPEMDNPSQTSKTWVTNRPSLGTLSLVPLHKQRLLAFWKISADL